MGDKVTTLDERYQGILEEMLQRLRKDLEEHLAGFLNFPGVKAGANGGMSQELWEDYLHQVNLFYYRTFHQRWFPVYREEIKRETSEIYRLSRQAELIREDVANNLIRYAQLLNRLKHFQQVLEELAREIRTRLNRMEARRAGVHHDLYQAMGELQGELLALESWFSNLEAVLSEPDWLDLVRDHRELQYLLTRWAEEESIEMDARERDVVNRWLAGLTRSIDVLSSLAGETELPPREIREHWNRGASVWPTVPPGMPVVLEEFIREEVSPRIKILGERVELNLEIEELRGLSPENSQREIGGVREYLTAVISALNKIIRPGQNRIHLELMGEARYLAGMKREDAGAMARLLREFDRELEAAKNKLAGGQDLSPLELDRLVEESVFRFERELRVRTERPDFRLTKKLAGKTADTLNRLALFGVKFSYFRDRLALNLEEIDHYRRLVEVLRKYGELFANIKADTETLLAPRSLRRAWKDMPVKVEHYPIVRGEKLPEGCHHLLNEFHIERKLVGEKEHLVVLEERGDIIRVEVDGLTRWEIPYLVVGLKE